MPASDPLLANAAALEEELNWLGQVLNARLTHYFNAEDAFDVATPDPPALAEPLSPYHTFIRDHQLGAEDRIALALSLAPHVAPRLLDVLFVRNKTFDRPFTEFGGEVHGGAFQPTGETLAFILGENDIARRLSGLTNLFDRDHVFTKLGVLSLVPGRETAEATSLWHRRLCISAEHLARFTTGADYRPEFGTDFPARLLRTPLAWDDLIVSEETLHQLEEVRRWLRHSETLRHGWGMDKHLRPGYRSLFHGPPGTGKSLAASLLGKLAARDVYRIDLSQVVSKWIGETEKNLSRLFDHAQSKGWILFFDEADALFGKRTETQSSNDRFANQEVAHLLQRIESFDGIAILATNLKENIDAAFLRRFESIVHFPIPAPAERLRLWQQLLPPPTICRLDSKIQLHELARLYTLTGAAIVNIVRDAALQALEEHQDQSLPFLTLAHLESALQKEYRKEGRSL